MLSRVLFNVYFNVIVNSLQHSKLGCELYGEYIGCLVYADDIILLSASVVMLQKMLSVCHITGLEIDVVFNAKKSTLFVVGKICDVEIGCLQIGGSYISWCTQMKYLGMHFRSDYNLSYDVDYAVRKFYTSAIIPTLLLKSRSYFC